MARAHGHQGRRDEFSWGCSVWKGETQKRRVGIPVREDSVRKGHEDVCRRVCGSVLASSFSLLRAENFALSFIKCIKQNHSETN